MLGISVYLSHENKKRNEQWVAAAKQYGFQSIFTSLHIPEDNPASYRELLRHLGSQAKRQDMELMADISPRSLQHLGVVYETAEELLEWGITGMRVDYGLSPQEIADLSHKMKIALNASTLTKEGLSELLHCGLCTERTEAWHNFYPRPETGLSKEYVREKNAWLRGQGITTMAFIAGDGEKRGPVYAGLPTLEQHRNARPLQAYLELTRECAVDKVLLGDISASGESMRELVQTAEGVIPLRCHADVSHACIGQVHTNRFDPARDVIRSVESRSYAGTGAEIMPLQTIERKRGSLTMDNKLYGRYSGELQITLTDLPADEKVNVIGKVIAEDVPLLSYIGPGQRFQIQHA